MSQFLDFSRYCAESVLVMTALSSSIRLRSATMPDPPHKADPVRGHVHSPKTRMEIKCRTNNVYVIYDIRIICSAFFLHLTEPHVLNMTLDLPLFEVFMVGATSVSSSLLPWTKNAIPKMNVLL